MKIKSFNNLRLICLIILQTVIISVRAQTEIYVSINGSDSHQGTKEKPYRSIERAQQEVRKVKEESKKDIIVFLREGIYELEKTLRFLPEDGGSSSRKVSYIAFNDENVILSGARLIGGFEKHNGRIIKRKLEVKDVRHLFRNEDVLIRARQPNNGDYNRLYMWDKQNEALYIQAEDIEAFDEEKNLEIHVQMNWATNIFRIASFEYTNNEASNWTNPRYAKLSFKQPEHRIIYDRNYPPKRPELAYHWENALSFLDTENEWFFNKESKVLYVIPPKHLAIEEYQLYVPHLDTLISVKGRKNTPVQNLHFEGLQFRHNNWNRPSEVGYVQLQAGNYNVKSYREIERLPAAVHVQYAQNISFLNNIFTDLATHALDFQVGVQNSLIKANIFYQVGGAAIAMAPFTEGYDDIHNIIMEEPENINCGENVVSNNLINKVAKDYVGTAAMNMGYVNDVLIEHNDISDTPWMGIHIGWGWSPAPNMMKNNTILRNKIRNTCDMLCDCGGIYTLSAQPNSLIKENVLTHIDKSEWACSTFNVGIYTDEGTTGYLIENNYINWVPAQKLKTKGDVHLKFNNKIDKPEVVAMAGLQPEYKMKLDNQLEELKSIKD